MAATTKKERDGAELIDGLAPGIDGADDLETELAETEKAENKKQLPRGEFQRNLGVPDVEPKGSASNQPEDERQWGDRSPKAQEKLQRG
jgi:hypothetical protein